MAHQEQMFLRYLFDLLINNGAWPLFHTYIFFGKYEIGNIFSPRRWDTGEDFGSENLISSISLSQFRDSRRGPVNHFPIYWTPA